MVAAPPGEFAAGEALGGPRRLHVMKQRHALLALITAFLFMAGCSDSSSRSAATPEPPHILLGDGDEVLLDTTGAGAVAQPVQDAFRTLDAALAKKPSMQELVVSQPGADEVLEGDDQAPRFLWRDPVDASDTWYALVHGGAAGSSDLRLLVLGGMPAESVFDPVLSILHAWTPSPAVWAAMVKLAGNAPVTVTFVGFAADAPDMPLSSGAVRFSVSQPD